MIINVPLKPQRTKKQTLSDEQTAERTFPIFSRSFQH